MIRASNHFEVALAPATMLFGISSGAALATVVGVLIEVPVMGVLIEVPVMLMLVKICLRMRHWLPDEKTQGFRLKAGAEIILRGLPAHEHPAHRSLWNDGKKSTIRFVRKSLRGIGRRRRRRSTHIRYYRRPEFKNGALSQDWTVKNECQEKQNV